MLGAERRQRIIEIVQERSIVSIAELASTLNAHETTIRRDLVEIEKDGVLKRTHGGVISIKRVSDENPFLSRASEFIEEKERIAAKACELINDGDQIILDAGTTTYQIAKKLLNRKNITVITNDINIGSELRLSPDIKVIVTGGVLTADSYMLNGIYTTQTLRCLRVNKAFISTVSIHAEFGLTHLNEQVVETKKQMIESAQKIIVVADHSKVGTVSLNHVCDIDQIHMLITDDKISKYAVNQFETNGVEVVIA